jgi:hypothetical protein
MIDKAKRGRSKTRKCYSCVTSVICNLTSYSTWATTRHYDYGPIFVTMARRGKKNVEKVLVSLFYEIDVFDDER